MKVSYTIPESLDEMKLSDYKKFMSIVENNDDNDFITMKLVEIFCGLKLKDVHGFPLNEVDQTANIINKAFEKVPKFTRDTMTFELNGIKYGFIPDIEKITMKEFVDIELFMKDINDLNKLMAILYRPIIQDSGDMYIIQEYDSNKSHNLEMNEMTLNYVIPSQVFFWNLGKVCLNHTGHYLDKELKEMRKTQNLANGGDGTTLLTQSQEATLQNLKTYLNLDYSSALHGWHTRKTNQKLNEVN